MTGIEFGWPWAFALLAPALAVWWLERRRDATAAARRLAALGPRADRLTTGATGAVGAGRRGAAAANGAGLAALVALVVAAAAPRWGEPEQQVEARGLDLVVCLDVSRSMLARDQAPDRLTAAHEAVQALCAAARGDRLALVAFAGDATLRVPLTEDLDSFAQLVATTDELAVTRPGTDLEQALDTALAALVGSTGGAAIVVLTDGEDLAGNGRRAAERCRAQGIVVHCVGFGSPRGAVIPVPGDGGETLLRDRDGREVVTALATDTLAALAAAGGGRFVAAAAAGPQVLVDLYGTDLAAVRRSAMRAGDERQPAERCRWFLLAALLFWSLRTWRLLAVGR